MNMRNYNWILAAMVLTALVGCTPTDNSGPAAEGETEVAAPTSADVTFASAIQPIIAGRCATCHVEGTKGGLSLNSLESALAGGKNGAAVVPGDAEGSMLYQMVAGLGEKRMPPKGDPLSDGDIATIKAWIDGGAK